ncbi:MAG: thioredoxin fold domain-containing protein [Burkholderiales bacterium]|nr:thioredoxin fold domain-containing protein [Burkholderiales bacterium]
MNIFKRWGCLIVTWALFGAAAAAAQLLPAEDLAQTAATAQSRRVPVLIAFMQQSCPYCAVARRDYLIPLQADPQWKNRVLIREIDVDRSTEMRDFAGTATTHRAFARSHDVTRVPTLIVFDADGKPVGPPLAGLMSDDFYRLYIEQAIEAGLNRMRPRGR